MYTSHHHLRPLLRSLAKVTMQMLASPDSKISASKNIRDQIVPVLVLLETTKCHLCAGNVLLRVLEVFELFPNVSEVEEFEGRLVDVPECLGSTQWPFACWRRCMRSPQRNQCDDRKGRASWGRSCFPHLHRECGIERIVS